MLKLNSLLIIKGILCSFIIGCIKCESTFFDLEKESFMRYNCAQYKNCDAVKDIPKCNYGDSECISNSINQLVANYPMGIPEIGLNSIDPFHYTDARVAEGNSTFAINLTIHDGFVYGWKNLRVQSLSGFDKDISKSKFEMTVSVPVDKVDGNYSATGKFLLFNIQGKGFVKFRFTNLRMKVKFLAGITKRDGEEYLDLKKVLLDISCDKMEQHFTNLFQDKAVSDNLNFLLNENERLIFEETKSGFGKARGKIIRDLLRPVFNKIPYRQLFL